LRTFGYGHPSGKVAPITARLRLFDSMQQVVVGYLHWLILGLLKKVIRLVRKRLLGKAKWAEAVLAAMDMGVADCDRRCAWAGGVPAFSMVVNFLNGDLTRRLGDLVMYAACDMVGGGSSPPGGKAAQLHRVKAMQGLVDVQRAVHLLLLPDARAHMQRQGVDLLLRAVGSLNALFPVSGALAKRTCLPHWLHDGLLCRS
jgi:hypothetical protein